MPNIAQYVPIDAIADGDSVAYVQGPAGDNGWSPIIALIADGSARTVQQIIRWVGGTGEPPASGLYIGATGLVTLIADAVSVQPSVHDAQVAQAAAEAAAIVAVDAAEVAEEAAAAALDVSRAFSVDAANQIVRLEYDLEIIDEENVNVGFAGSDPTTLLLGWSEDVQGAVGLLAQDTVDAFTKTTQLRYFRADEEQAAAGVLALDDETYLDATQPGGARRLLLDATSAKAAYDALPGLTQPFFNEDCLSRWRSKYLDTSHNGGRTSWVTIGDSESSYRHYVTELVYNMQLAPWGFNGGAGWFSAFNTAGDGLATGVTSAYTSVTSAGWVGNDIKTSESPNLFMVTSSTPGATIAITAGGGETVVNGFGRSGTIEYRWNGGAWIPKAFTGDAFQSWTLTGNPSTAGVPWTLEIRVVSGTVKLIGFDLRYTTKGTRVHKWGYAGTYTTQWAGIDATTFQVGLAGVEADLVSIFHGINDQGVGQVTPQQYYENLKTICQRVLVARPQADILLVSPYEPRTTGVPMWVYSKYMRRVAIEMNVAHLDLQQSFGRSYYDYMWQAPRQLLGEDAGRPDIHTDARGDAIIVSKFTAAGRGI